MILSKVLSRFAMSTRVYGNLPDADRIFTNVYKDTDPYIDGALRRVLIITCRETGIEPRTY